MFRLIVLLAPLVFAAGCASGVKTADATNVQPSRYDNTEKRDLAGFFTRKSDPAARFPFGEAAPAPERGQNQRGSREWWE